MIGSKRIRAPSKYNRHLNVNSDELGETIALVVGGGVRNSMLSTADDSGEVRVAQAYYRFGLFVTDHRIVVSGRSSVCSGKGQA